MPNGMVKMSSHRKGFGRPINENDDPVLHRLVLSSHGRKLNEFVTFYSTHARSQEDEHWCAHLTLFQDPEHLMNAVSLKNGFVALIDRPSECFTMTQHLDHIVWPLWIEDVPTAAIDKLREATQIGQIRNRKLSCTVMQLVDSRFGQACGESLST